MKNLNTDEVFKELKPYQKKMYNHLVYRCGFQRIGAKTTICLLVLNNSMEIIGQSQCVDPDNYDHFIGAKYALENAIDKNLSDIWAFAVHSNNTTHPDKRRLDFMQKLTDEAAFTGKVVMRDSTTGRGWRIHETDTNTGVKNVREAIDNYMKANNN